MKGFSASSACARLTLVLFSFLFSYSLAVADPLVGAASEAAAPVSYSDEVAEVAGTEAGAEEESESVEEADKAKEEEEEEEGEEKEESEELLEKGVHFQEWDDPDAGVPSIDAVYNHPRTYEPSKVEPLNANVLGDSINPLDGQLSFSATDVSLPGNSHLPVEFTRRLSGFFSASAAEFGFWRLNLPSIETMTFVDEPIDPSNTRLNGIPNFDWHDNRCDRFSLPSFRVDHWAIENDMLLGWQLLAKRRSETYFNGLTLNAPGAWGEKILRLQSDDALNNALFDNNVPRYVTNRTGNSSASRLLKEEVVKVLRGSHQMVIPTTSTSLSIVFRKANTEKRGKVCCMPVRLCAQCLPPRVWKMFTAIG